MPLRVGHRQGAARSCRQTHLAALPAKTSKEAALQRGKLRHEVPHLGSPGTQPAPVCEDEQSLGSKLGLDPHNHPGLSPASSQELGTFASHRDAFPSPKGAATLPKPHSLVPPGPSGSATAALQRQPWNFSQALGCPQKCCFLQECAEPGGLRCPAPPRPQLLPFPGTGASPARALTASPSCSHAPDFLPRGPPSCCRFFSRLSQHQAALCGCVKGKQAGEAARRQAGSPPLPGGV